MANRIELARTLDDVGQRGSYLAAVDYPILESLGKLTCGTDFQFYGNTQEIVVPTEIDACLLGLLLVFIPTATIFNEEFRGKVEGFLQRSGLDKIQEGGGFFERLQEGFNRLQNDEVIKTSSESPIAGIGYNSVYYDKPVQNPNQGYKYQQPQKSYPNIPIVGNLKLVNNQKQQPVNNYQAPIPDFRPVTSAYPVLPVNSYQPQVNNYPTIRGNDQAPGAIYQAIEDIYQSPSNTFQAPFRKQQVQHNNSPIQGNLYQSYPAPTYQPQRPSYLTNAAYQEPGNRYSLIGIQSPSNPGASGASFQTSPSQTSLYNQVPMHTFNQQANNPVPFSSLSNGFINNGVYHRPTNGLTQHKKIAISDILKKPIETPMRLISGFMQKMKQVGSNMKSRNSFAKPIPVPSTTQIPITAQPEDYKTNFDEVNSIKSELYDLADISEKELLAYSRVQAMLSKFEQEQAEKEEEKAPQRIIGAIPAPLENPFDSIINNSNRRSDAFRIGNRRSSYEMERTELLKQPTVIQFEFPNIFNVREEFKPSTNVNDPNKLYLVKKLEKSDLSDEELVDYLRVQQLLNRISRKL